MTTFISSHMPSHKLARERYELIAQDYKAGLPIAVIGDKYHVKSTTVRRALTKCWVTPDRQHKLTEAQIDVACKKYLNTKATCADLARKYGVSEAQMIDKLRARGIRIYNKAKQRFNEHYFDNMGEDTTKWYIFGLFLADGSVDASKERVSINLQVRDKPMLYRILRELKSENQTPCIHRRQYSPGSQDSYAISFSSKHMCKTLSDLGMVHRKTYHLKWSYDYLSERALAAFLRGYFEGNGCCSFGLQRQGGREPNLYVASYFASTEHFCKGLQRRFKKIFPDMHWSVSKNGKSNGWLMQMRKMKDQPLLHNWLYKDSTIHIAAKRNKVYKMLKTIKAYVKGKKTA